MRTSFGAEISYAAHIHNLEPALVEAVVLTESSGKAYAYRYEAAFWTKYLAEHIEYKDKNPERVSASYGLMQILYVVARELGMPATLDPEYLFIPTFNLEYGCRKLRQLLEWSHGVVPQALAAYNGGKVQNALPPYRNQLYVNKVMKNYQKGSL